MRFKYYLSEATDINWIFEFIDKYCKQYTDDIKKMKSPGFDMLLSGRREHKDFFIKIPRTDRKPLDTPIEIHKVVDEWFYKKFGVKARSESLFVTFDSSEALEFGEVYFVFPIGNYKVISSNRVKDLYDLVVSACRDIMGGSFYIKDEWRELSDDIKKKIYDSVTTRLDNANYKEGIQNNPNEMMLICKKCCLVDYNKYFREILDKFGG